MIRKAIAAISAIFLLLHAAQAGNFSSFQAVSAPSSTFPNQNSPIGTNLAGTQYYSTTFAYLNLLKQTSSFNTDINCNYSDTQEMTYVYNNLLDSNGYVTSFSSMPTGSFTASATSSTTMVVTGTPSGAVGSPWLGGVLSGTGITGSPTIVGCPTGGCGIAGNYTLSATQNFSSTTVTETPRFNSIDFFPLLSGLPPFEPGGAGSWEFIYDGADNSGSTWMAYGFDLSFASHNCTGGTCTDVLNVNPGGNMKLCQSGTNPANHVTNMRLVQTKYAALLASGEYFNPDWIAIMNKFRSIRTMDWNATNTNTFTSWSQREPVTWIFWNDIPKYLNTQPYEVEIALANELNATLWMNSPCLGDSTFDTNLATLVKANIKPTLHVVEEKCNEIWNENFGGNGLKALMNADGLANFPGVPNDGYTPTFISGYYHSILAADAWASVWTGADASRLYRSVGLQYSYSARDQAILGYASGATFTGVGSGFLLTASSVTGTIGQYQTITGTGIPANTTITGQVSGTLGGAGVYNTSAATTVNGAVTSSLYGAIVSWTGVLASHFNAGNVATYFPWGEYAPPNWLTSYADNGTSEWEGRLVNGETPFRIMATLTGGPTSYALASFLPTKPSSSIPNFPGTASIPGTCVSYQVNTNSSGSPTLAVDGLTAHPIQALGGGAMTLVAGTRYVNCLNAGGTAWVDQGYNYPSGDCGNGSNVTCGGPSAYTITTGQSLPATPSNGTCITANFNIVWNVTGPTLAADGGNPFPIYGWDGLAATPPASYFQNPYYLCLTSNSILGSASPSWQLYQGQDAYGSDVQTLQMFVAEALQDNLIPYGINVLLGYEGGLGAYDFCVFSSFICSNFGNGGPNNKTFMSLIGPFQYSVDSTNLYVAELAGLKKGGMQDWNQFNDMFQWSQSIYFTASISNGSGGAGTNLVVTSLPYGYFNIGGTLIGAGIASGTVIVSCPTANCNTTGTYIVNNSQNVPSEKMGLYNPGANFFWSFSPGTYWSPTPTGKQNGLYTFINTTPCWWAGCGQNFLLKRDLDPASNDNSPMWLDKAG